MAGRSARYAGGRSAAEGLASGTLTFEDAPPKSYGGKPVALTCRPCNNSSGYMYTRSLQR